MSLMSQKHQGQHSHTMKLRLCLTILLLLIPFYFVWGQRSRLYTSDGELSSGLINKITKDSRGYIWIATENGLNLFDGTRFKTYFKERDNEHSLPSNYVHTIFETSLGRIIVGCLSGLVEYDHRTDSFSPIPLIYNGEEHPAHVMDLLELSNGEIWIATAGMGIFVLNQDENQAVSLDNVSTLIDNDFISVLFEDSAHTIWIGTEKSGLIRYYPSANTIRRYTAPSISGNLVTSITEHNGNGNVIVGTLDGGVDTYNANSESFTHIPGPLAAVKTLAKNDGHILVGTDGQGLMEFNGTALRPAEYIYPDVESQNLKVHQILCDNNGNIWLGLFQKGVAFVPVRRSGFLYAGKMLGQASTIGDKCITAVFADGENGLWVGSDNGGIFQLDKNGSQIRHIDIDPTVMCFMRASTGELWAGTYPSGAYVLRGDSFEPISELADRKIYSLLEISDGRIFIGSLDKGLEVFNPSTGKVINCTELSEENGYLAPLNFNAVNALCADYAGRIWVGHYDGISCFDPSSNRFVDFDGNTNLISCCVGYTIHASANHETWLGTSDGLYLYDKNGVTRRYSTENGLPSDLICGIAEDRAGNIWLSTYHGLARLSADRTHISSFDFGDGLQGNEFTHGAYCTDDRGMMYFGGTNGLTYFHPLDIENRRANDKLAITEVGAYNGPSGNYQVLCANCSPNEKIRLSAKQNSVKIYFSTLSYDNPDKIRFEYRLREQDNKWYKTEPGQEMVTFYNLSPDTYHFDVRIEDNPNRTTSILIIVSPPWYFSWWACAVYFCLLLALIGFFFHQHRQRSRVEDEMDRTRRAEELAEAKLKLFTSFSHEIRTPMTLIIDPLRKLIDGCTNSELLATYNTIYRNASRILALVNQLMDLRKLEKGQMKLQARETDLVGFIEDVLKPFEQYAATHSINIVFTHDMDRCPCWLDLEHFDKVLMNLLSNAFKHTPSNGEIEIILTRDADSIHIAVQDTGHGIPAESIEHIFERFYQAGDDRTSGVGTGIGLNLVREIVLLHHGTIEAQNRTDGSGARFVITIPLGNSHLSKDEILSVQAPAPVLPSLSAAGTLPETSDSTFEKADGRNSETIVVIEDDDEIRSYIVSLLRQHYRTVMAFSTADEAYSAILRRSPAPDLIISDVMMPGTDGITFTRRLRQNANTNHIPVILLTARSGQGEMKEGIDSGADQYIPKPFNSDLLLSSVANLLSNRHMLRVKFSGSQEQDDKVNKISMKSADEVLMNKIMDAINRNISSPDFSVERLASEVGLSRAHLHRKLKELTNFSARDFIKNIRMRQAARLLAGNKLSIAQVAYAVGFANASHFSLVFKEYFGETPSQYIINQKSIDSGSTNQEPMP